MKVQEQKKLEVAASYTSEKVTSETAEKKSFGVSETKDKFEQSQADKPNSKFKSELDTITGGYQRGEVPKGNGGGVNNPQQNTNQDLPKGSGWMDGKGVTHGISWGARVKQKDESTSSPGVMGDPKESPTNNKKVGLDHFDKNKQVMAEIIADKNDFNNVGGMKRPDKDAIGNSGSMDNFGIPGRGYGKNKVSEGETIGKKPGSNYQVIEKENEYKGQTVIYNTRSNDRAFVMEKKDNEGNIRYTKEIGIDGSEKETSYDKDGKVLWEENRASTITEEEKFEAPKKIDDMTPNPDSTDETHAPKGIIVGRQAPEVDRASGYDQIALHDENKRQQENVVVGREEIYGSMVGRRTDGRSTPIDNETPSGSSSDPSTPLVDVPTQHRKGDPADGEGGKQNE